MGVQLTTADVIRLILRAANARRVKMHYTVGWRTAALKLLLKQAPEAFSARVVGRLGR